MAKYKLFHADTEILGQVLLNLEDAVGADRFERILERHGLTTLEPERWYPGQTWVDVLNEIAELPSPMMNFVSLGMQQMLQVVWPPDYYAMSFGEILIALDDVYQENYRGTDVGSIRAEKVTDSHYKLTVRSFEPDDLWYGNIYGLTRVLGKKTDKYTVFYDEELRRREKGGEVTVIHVQWE